MIVRNLHSELKTLIKDPRPLFLYGPRHGGKTTIMKYLERELSDDRQTLFLSLDRHRLASFAAGPEQLMAHARRLLKPAKNNIPIIFIDEIYYLPQPAKFISALNEHGADFQLVFSSSSLYRLWEAGEPQSESIRRVYVPPLTWTEYARLCGIAPPAAGLFSFHELNRAAAFYGKYAPLLRHELIEYLRWGGYPEVANAGTPRDREDKLFSILHDYMTHDAMRLLEQNQHSGYISTLRLLARPDGKFLNRSDICLRLKLHRKVLDKFLLIGRDTFILAFLPPFFQDARREMSKMKKIYFTDTGLSGLLSDHLHASELPALLDRERLSAFVHNELNRRREIDSLAYYRTIAKAGVDFILRIGGQLVPLQIAADRRELRPTVAVKNFIKKYGGSSPRVIIATHNQEPRIDGMAIYMPAALLPFMRFDTLL